MTKPQTHAQQKWGSALEPGFQILPNLLIANQSRLRITPTEMVVLLHLNRYWWSVGNHPFPSPDRIAEQMGLHRRSVQRCFSRLETKGLIQRLRLRALSNGSVVRPISLVPLADALRKIADGEISNPPAPPTDRKAGAQPDPVDDRQEASSSPQERNR